MQNVKKENKILTINSVKSRNFEKKRLFKDADTERNKSIAILTLKYKINENKQKYF